MNTTILHNMKLTVMTVFICFAFQHIQSQTMGRHDYIKNDSVHIDLINPFLAPMEIKIVPLDSTKHFVKHNSYGLLKHNDTLKSAVVIPLNYALDSLKTNIKEYISFDAKFGDPNIQIDKSYKYTLPYPKGKRYKIIQSFGGKFSHSKPHSRYAIDFSTQIGDTITAARSGKVYFVKQDSEEHCPTRKCIGKANKIMIIHEDGTMAHYVHLDFDGALVQVGDQVNVGQPIAISGMSGFTTTPHLHFVVYASGGISIPFYFNGLRQKKLKQGKYYTRRK